MRHRHWQRDQNYPKYSVKAGIDVISTISTPPTAHQTEVRHASSLNGNPRAVSIESAEKPGHFLNTVADHFVVIMSNGYVRLQSLRNPRHYIRQQRVQAAAGTLGRDQAVRPGHSSWKRSTVPSFPCETKAFVYNPAYENARGPHCEFGPPGQRPSPIKNRDGTLQEQVGKVKKIVLGKGWHDERKFIVKNNGHSRQRRSAANTLRRASAASTGFFDATGKALPDSHWRCTSPRRLAGHVIAQVLSNMTELFKPVGHGAAVVSAKGRSSCSSVTCCRRACTRFVNYDGAFTTPSCNPWRAVASLHRLHEDPEGAVLLKFTKTFFDKAKKRPNGGQLPASGRPEIRCSFSNKEASPEEVKKVASETRVVS
uniref:Alpha-carbonic anhydrase domain-containing protein n=1 Tax=Macrostomum lignano TaxID=282301 RepID=A0A1I8FLP6_9PLAT